MTSGLVPSISALSGLLGEVAGSVGSIQKAIESIPAPDPSGLKLKWEPLLMDSVLALKNSALALASFTPRRSPEQWQLSPVPEMLVKMRTMEAALLRLQAQLVAFQAEVEAQGYIVRLKNAAQGLR